jgi:hypothetical protein
MSSESTKFSILTAKCGKEFSRKRFDGSLYTQTVSQIVKTDLKPIPNFPFAPLGLSELHESHRLSKFDFVNGFPS